MSTQTHSTMRTQATLLHRIRDWEDHESWTRFDQIYRGYVFSQARKAGLTAEESEDLVQDVFKRVAETIGAFDTGRDPGSFRRWLTTLVGWRIKDKISGRDRGVWGSAHFNKKDSEDGTATINQIPDVNAENQVDEAWEKEWQKHLLDAAFESVAKKVKAQHYQIFELYARQGWSVLRIAKELDMNVATVYVTNHRLTKILKAEVSYLRSRVG